MKKTDDKRRMRGQAAWKKGHWSEEICAWSLRLKGWRIVARRYKTFQGEIDLVAVRGRQLIIVEVKARPTLDEARGAIHLRQQRRLNQAAAAFLARYPQYISHFVSFDAVLIAPWRWPQHIRNAWLSEGVSF